MRFFLAFMLSLALVGCGSFDNPLTQNQLYNAENGYGVALAAMKGYRQSCVDKVVGVYPQCRTIVPELQDSVRKAEGARKAAQEFVKNNPTVSPTSLIAAFQQAVTDFQAVETKYGVK